MSPGFRGCRHRRIRVSLTDLCQVADFDPSAPREGLPCAPRRCALGWGHSTSRLRHPADPTEATRTDVPFGCASRITRSAQPSLMRVVFRLHTSAMTRGTKWTPIAFVGLTLLTGCSRGSAGASTDPGTAEGSPLTSAASQAAASTNAVPSPSPSTATCLIRAEGLTNANGAATSERALSAWLRTNSEGFNPDRTAWHPAGDRGEYTDRQGHRVTVIRVDRPSHGYVVSQATTCV